MLISGSLKEIRTIVERALVTGADFINFIAPNQILIVHHTRDEYTFLKTNLFISHSAVLGKRGFENLRKFIKLALGTRNNPDSPYYQIIGETISLTETSITFDNNEDLQYDMHVEFTPLEAISAINQKTEPLKLSSIDTRYPFLKVKRAWIKHIYKSVKHHDALSLSKDNHNSLNDLYLNEVGDLLVEPLDGEGNYKEIVARSETDFIVSHKFKHHRFPVYDMDIVMLYKLSSVWPIESFVFIPYEKFYIVEAHTEEQMISKIHMKLTYYDKKAHLL